jgi:predicted DsbA family dithiol-disulfide isomerase
MPGRVTVNIVSDTICPWCFVGKRRFESALAKAASVTAEVRWRPFFLDKSIPAAGVDKMAHYVKKFGQARVDSMLPMMKKVGEAEGIAFDYGGRIANTLASHALLELAFQSGGAKQQDALCTALFKYYFEQQGNLGDAAALRGLCAAEGLAGEAVEGVLAGSSPLCQAVVQEAEEWRQEYAISGVPFFVIQAEGKKPVLLSGAQDTHVLVAALEKACA